MLVIAKPMVLRLGLAAAVATTFLAGCAAHYRASDFVRAGPGGPFDTTQALALLPSGYRVETGSVATPDGARLYRVAFMHPQARSDLLLFGGNLFRSDTQAAFAARHVLAAWRGNLVLYDYRGRGQSSGVPSVAALRSDALLAFDTEMARSTRAGRKLALGGFSLGGVMAAAVTEQRTPAALLLLATTTDAREHADAVMPWYAKRLVRLQIDPEVAAVDNRRALRRYTGPLLVAVGADDRATPPALSKRLYEVAATPAEHKQIHVLPGVGHNNLLAADEFGRALSQFMQAHGL